MKKSEIYQLAQIAVVSSPCIAPESKVEMLRVLFNEEDLCCYIEERDAKKMMSEKEIKANG